MDAAEGQMNQGSSPARAALERALEGLTDLEGEPAEDLREVIREALAHLDSAGQGG
jgi:hypothetical protein